MLEYVRAPAGRAVGGPRAENRTPDGFSSGLLGGDLTGSMGGGAAYGGLAEYVGEGGVYTLRAFGGGDEVELDLFDDVLRRGGAEGGSSALPVCLRCSKTANPCQQGTRLGACILTFFLDFFGDGCDQLGRHPVRT